MAFNLFGLLPDPDEAERNAPQLPLDTNLLNQLQQRLTGLDETQETQIRDRFRNATNRSIKDSRRNLDQVNNSATAIAGNQQLSRDQQDTLVDGEQLITEQNIQLSENAQDRFNQEFTRQDNRRAQNKEAREFSREQAKLARRQIGANLATTGIGIAGSVLAGPNGVLTGNDNEDNPNLAVQASQGEVGPPPIEDNFQRAEVPTDVLSTEAPDVRRLNDVRSGAVQFREGDSLQNIADRAGITVTQLMIRNGITDPLSIEPGQLINVL